MHLCKGFVTKMGGAICSSFCDSNPLDISPVWWCHKGHYLTKTFARSLAHIQEVVASDEFVSPSKRAECPTDKTYVLTGSWNWGCSAGFCKQRTKHPGQLFIFIGFFGGWILNQKKKKTGVLSHTHRADRKSSQCSYDRCQKKKKKVKKYVYSLCLGNSGWLTLQIKTLTLTAFINCKCTGASHMFGSFFLLLLFSYFCVTGTKK